MYSRTVLHPLQAQCGQPTDAGAAYPHDTGEMYSPKGAGAAYNAGAGAMYSSTGAGATQDTAGAGAMFSTADAGAAYSTGANDRCRCSVPCSRSESTTRYRCCVPNWRRKLMHTTAGAEAASPVQNNANYTKTRCWCEMRATTDAWGNVAL